MSKWSNRYPPGSIKTREEFRDLVIEARKGKKAIRIYLVEQMGHLREVFLTSKSQLTKSNVESLKSDERQMRCHVMAHGLYKGERYYPTYILMGSYSIGVMSSEHHRAFTNRMSAEQYASELKNDPKYVAEVKAHWARCESLFGRFGA